MKPKIYKSPSGYWKCKMQMLPTRKYMWADFYEQTFLGGFEDLKERLNSGLVNFESE